MSYFSIPGTLRHSWKIIWCSLLFSVSLLRQPLLQPGSDFMIHTKSQENTVLESYPVFFTILSSMVYSIHKPLRRSAGTPCRKSGRHRCLGERVPGFKTQQGAFRLSLLPIHSVFINFLHFFVLCLLFSVISAITTALHHACLNHQLKVLHDLIH